MMLDILKSIGIAVFLTAVTMVAGYIAAFGNDGISIVEGATLVGVILILTNQGVKSYERNRA